MFGPASGTVGRMQASILGSKGVVLPTPWFQERTGTLALAASRQTPIKDADGEPIQPEQVPLDKLPAAAAVESRIELGTETQRQRVIYSRSTIQISEITFSQPHRATIGPNSFQIEPGSCYLIAGWTEKVL